MMTEREEIKRILTDRRFTDTRIGTKSSYAYSNGNTLPLIGIPHGQNYFAVQTNEDRGAWWFDPESDQFEGFRLTHQPSPWMGDFSYLTILPYEEGQEKITYNLSQSIFRPNFNEIIYQSGAKARLAAGRQEGLINFQSNDKPIIFQLKSPGIRFEKKDNLILGQVVNMAHSEDKNFTMHVVIGLDSDFNLEEEENLYRIYTSKTKTSLAIATSFISAKQAKINYDRMAKDMASMLKKSSQAWLKYFDRIEIEKNEDHTTFSKYERYDNTDQIKFFYHAIYRSFLFPMKMYERDETAEIVHYDTISKTVKPGRLYTNIGFWDAQKTLFPLLSLIAVKDYEHILEGILNSYRNAGFLPKWLSPDERGLMPGTLVDNVIADAASKDLGNTYLNELFDAMLKSARTDSGDARYGRAAVDDYQKYGYVPSHYHESVNQTLDNALSDYSISVVAKKLDKLDLAKEYMEKSKGYKHLFDPESKLLRAKDKDGKFTEDFNPYQWGSPYTEGNAYQNSYNMVHDIPGLIDLFASKEAFEARLDEMANAKIKYDVGVYGHVIHEIAEYEAANFGHIAISNQPSFHLPYLYNYVDKPWKSELLVKELMQNYFKYQIDGYPGDEDNGSLSAWFILSAMGIYPVCPGSGQYALGIPFYDLMRIKLSNGESLEIKVDENFHHKKFVIERKVDGKNIDEAFISHQDFINAKRIEHTLGIVPKG